MERLFHGKTETEKEKEYEIMNEVFKKIKSINTALLEKSNSDKLHFETTIDQAMDFYISSFGLSFIKNIYLQNIDSIGQLMNMRCILEGIATKQYFKKNTNEKDINLFRLQPFILERNIYKKFPEFDKVIFDLNQINFNFEKTREQFKLELSISQSDFADLTALKIPFLNNRITFAEIVRDEFGEEVEMIYRQLSLFVHPHDYRLVLNNEDLINSFEYVIFLLLSNIYKSEKAGHIIGLEEEYNILLGENFVGAGLRELISRQRKLVYKIGRVCAENNLGGFGVILSEYVPLLYDFSLDIIFGYSEHGTTKLKNLLELLGVLDLCSDDKYLRSGSKLMTLHTNCMYNQNNRVSSDELVVEAYKEYKKQFPRGVSKEMFDNNFLRTLGFLMDENGHVPTLVSLSKKIIDKYSKNIRNNEIESKEGLKLKLDSYMTMKYYESQIMSHASGYLMFTTTGAWFDGMNMIVFMDAYLNEVLKAFLDKYRLEDDRSKMVVNVIRNYLRDVKDIMNKKAFLMSKERSGKNF